MSDGPLLRRRFQLSFILPEQMIHILLGFHHGDRTVLLPMGLLQPISCILGVEALPLDMKFGLTPCRLREMKFFCSSTARAFFTVISLFPLALAKSAIV